MEFTPIGSGEFNYNESGKIKKEKQGKKGRGGV
jgi:hypothetical protein